MKKHERIIAISAFFFTIITVVLLAIFLPPGARRSPPLLSSNTHTLTGGTTTIDVDYAITPEQELKGLSGRASLPEGSGMLFIFSKNAPPFWMPDMHFAIDIVWIGSDKRIVDVSRNATPESYPTLFKPKSPARYVLEIPSGDAEKYSWQEGTPLTFSAPSPEI